MNAGLILKRRLLDNKLLGNYRRSAPFGKNQRHAGKIVFKGIKDECCTC
jgi:hypothetical protein